MTFFFLRTVLYGLKEKKSEKDVKMEEKSCSADNRWLAVDGRGNVNIDRLAVLQGEQKGKKPQLSLNKF